MTKRYLSLGLLAFSLISAQAHARAKPGEKSSSAVNVKLSFKYTNRESTEGAQTKDCSRQIKQAVEGYRAALSQDKDVVNELNDYSIIYDTYRSKMTNAPITPDAEKPGLQIDLSVRSTRAADDLKKGAAPQNQTYVARNLSIAAHSGAKSPIDGLKAQSNIVDYLVDQSVPAEKRCVGLVPTYDELKKLAIEGIHKSTKYYAGQIPASDAKDPKISQQDSLKTVPIGEQPVISGPDGESASSKGGTISE